MKAQHHFGGLFDFFSSSSTTFTPAQQQTAGQTWLVSVYNALKPNATQTVFFNALKLDGYSDPIPDEDFLDFVKTVGFNVLTSPTIGDRVKASLLASFSSNRNMLPSRKSIISAFLNPDNVSWTYWDAVKVTSSELATDAVAIAKGVSDTVVAGANTLGFIWKYKLPIAIVTLGGLGYFLYQNRDELLGRIKEKGFKSIGLGK